MTPRLDRAALCPNPEWTPDRVPLHEAAALVERLGWLAPWWLDRQVRERVAKHQPAYHHYLARPKLLLEPGLCWPVFVRDGVFPLLARACLLPLHWEPGTHDLYLPPPLRELAGRVVEQLQPDGCWGLQLSQPLGVESVDLAGLDKDTFGVESAWAALVGGLRLAQDGGYPNPAVWVSAAWDPRYGIGHVEGLHAKLDLAEAHGATRMFVPAADQLEATAWQEQHPGACLQVALLRPHADPGRSPSATQVLADYLEELETQPAKDESFDRRKGYYARIRRDRAKEYYWTHLMQDAIARCQTTLDERLRAGAVTHVVTVVSAEAPVVALAAAVLQARHCLLLHEQQDAIVRNRDRVAGFLRGLGLTVTWKGLTLGDRNTELSQVNAEVSRFLAGVAPARSAIDLTPGYKSLSLELQEVAPPGGWLLYCRHHQLPPDNRVEPGSEHYDSWLR